MFHPYLSIYIIFLSIFIFIGPFIFCFFSCLSLSLSYLSFSSLLYSTLLYTTLFYPKLLHPPLHYPILSHSPLSYPPPFYPLYLYSFLYSISFLPTLPSSALSFFNTPIVTSPSSLFTTSYHSPAYSFFSLSFFLSQRRRVCLPHRPFNTRCPPPLPLQLQLTRCAKRIGQHRYPERNSVLYYREWERHVYVIEGMDISMATVASKLTK